MLIQLLIWKGRVATDFCPLPWWCQDASSSPESIPIFSSCAFVQVYDIGAFSFLGLNSSVLVPPILVSFYIVFGTFQILADRALIARPSTQEALSKLSPQYLLVNTWCFVPPAKLESSNK